MLLLQENMSVIFLLLRITYILRKEGRKLPFKNCEVFKDRQEMY